MRFFIAMALACALLALPAGAQGLYVKPRQGGEQAPARGPIFYPAPTPQTYQAPPRAAQASREQAAAVEPRADLVERALRARAEAQARVAAASVARDARDSRLIAAQEAYVAQRKTEEEAAWARQGAGGQQQGGARDSRPERARPAEPQTYQKPERAWPRRLFGG